MNEEAKSKPWLIPIIVLVSIAALVGLWRVASVDDEHSGADGAAKAEAANAERDASTGAAIRIDSGGALLAADKAVITGSVRDEQGRGIAGATVCAWADEGELLGAGDLLPRCATSEHDGHYRVEGLWPVANRVSASAPEFMPGKWRADADGRGRDTLRLRPGQERGEIDIVLERGGVAVRGIVKDISGGVIEGALVSAGSGWWFGDSPRAVTRTDADGRFELWAKPGGNSLQARADGYASARRDVRAPTDLAEIFLTPESVISGTVVDARTGAPIAQATVTAVTAGFFSNSRGTALSDAEGRFRISGLEPGTYDVRAVTDELYGEAVEQLPLGLSQSATEVVVPVYPAFSLSGTIVVAETGEPCPEGAVSLEGGGFQAFDASDERGEIMVRGLMPGEYEIAVRCDDHVPEADYEAIVVSDGNLVGVEWKVHAGLAIRGVVVDSGGAPIADIDVNAAAKALAGADPRRQQTSSWGSDSEDDGSFELLGLLPGSYELDVWSEDHPALAEPELVELGEAADVEGVRLVLPATGGLIGRVRDESGAAMPGVSVSASLLGSRHSSASTETGDDGRFAFESVELGPTRVQARVDWDKSMRAPGTSDDDIQGETVEVVAGREVEVELVVEARALRISGRVVDSTGAPVGDAFLDATRLSDSAAGGSRRARWSMRWGWDEQPVLSEADGTFEIDELAAGDYMVRAYREGGGEAFVEGIAAGSTGVELTIVDTGSISGTVTLAGGGSPERFEVQVYNKAEALTRTDEFFRTRGAFAFRELPPGNYVVMVSAKQGSAEAKVELAPGEVVEGLKIALVPKLVVVGRLVDADTRAPVPGMKVQVFSSQGVIMFDETDDGGEHRDVSDAAGRFEVEDVPSGSVRVWIMPRDFSEDGDYGWTSRKMTLPSEPERQDLGDIELLASRLDGDEKPGDLGFKTKELGVEVEAEDRYFEVAVIRPGGPADGSGLELGQRIEQVDGRGVTGLDRHRFSTLTRAPPGTTIELGIEGGETVKITLGPALE